MDIMSDLEQIDKDCRIERLYKNGRGGHLRRALQQRDGAAICKRILWQRAQKEIIRSLHGNEESAFGVLLLDSSVGLYRIILQQNPEPGGRMYIRWGDYSENGKFYSFEQNLQRRDDNILELESDLCDLWLYQLTDLRHMGSGISKIVAYKNYDFAFFSSDLLWSLKSLQCQNNLSENNHAFAFKSRVKELVADIVLRADRELPLWKQRGLMRNLSAISDRYAIQNGIFEINFSPAGNAPITITIVRSGYELKLIARYGGEKEEYHIKAEVADNFFKVIHLLLEARQFSSSSIIHDDISVDCHLRIGSSWQFSHKFVSPQKAKHPKDYGIVEAVFYVLGSLRLSASLKVYLDRLSMYFFESGPFRFVKI
jgi:hypothetical protein